MRGKPQDGCGVVGLVSSSSSMASRYIYFALRALQHRGQESAGIAMYGRDLSILKDLGLVGDIFHDRNLKKLRGKKGIGHVYYSVKLSTPENAQPYVVETESGKIALAHNGIITNSELLKRRMESRGHSYRMGSEEETMAFMISDEIREGSDIVEAIKTMMIGLRGSYALTILHNGRVFGIRDPLGIKPLCLGEFDGGHIIASESVAVDVLEGKFLRDVRPGEVVELTNNGFKCHQILNYKKKARCFFEYVYFSRADSVIDGKWVYEVRKRIGRRLAKEYPVKADVVVPVPDSGRSHALGFSEESAIPVAEGLMKNRYIARTFIMPDQKARDLSVREKVNPVKPVVDGKRIVLVDDSIVRGTTMRRIIETMRQAGAREVHVRIGSPPIIAPCYLGIDMTTRDQFLATGKTIEEIRQTLGADSVGYISVQGVVDAIGFSREDLCLGCVTARYPVDIPNEMHRFQRRLLDFGSES